MPFYEYECSACNHQLEVLQKMADAPLRKCPDCGKSALKRLISAPVFRLKGAGWYETDFKSDQEQKRNIAGGEEGESKPAEDKSEAKDTKDAKGDAKGSDAKGSDAKPSDGKSESRDSKSESRIDSSRSDSSKGEAKPERKAIRKPVKAAAPVSKPKPAKAKAKPTSKASSKKKSKRR